MGTLRLRHCELLNAIGKMLIEQNCRRAIQSFIRTCASVHYFPPSLSTLIEQIDEREIAGMEIKPRLDLLWSWTILDRLEEKHLDAVLNQEMFQSIKRESSKHWKV
jgi:hypothetical protein